MLECSLEQLFFIYSVYLIITDKWKHYKLNFKLLENSRTSLKFTSAIPRHFFGRRQTTGIVANLDILDHGDARLYRCRNGSIIIGVWFWMTYWLYNMIPDIKITVNGEDVNTEWMHHNLRYYLVNYFSD